MITAALSETLQYISIHGYWVALALSIIEGPIITVMSGLLVSLQVFNWWTALFVLVLGDLVGDALYYGAGRYGGHWFVRRFGKYVGISESSLDEMSRGFAGNHFKILIFAKTQAIGSAILFSAGLVRVHFGQFMLYNAIGSVPKTLLLLAVGFYFGYALSDVSNYLWYAGLALTSAGVLCILYFGIQRAYGANKRTIL